MTYILERKMKGRSSADMADLLFINNGISQPRLKVYDEGYIVFDSGYFQLMQQFGDELCVVEQSQLGKYHYGAKSAFVAYCQVITNRDVLARLLANFSNKENLKFLRYVFTTDNSLSLQNPEIFEFTCEVLPLSIELFGSGVFVNVSTEHTMVSIAKDKTIALKGTAVYQRLFTIYFALYLAGKIKCLPPNSAESLYKYCMGGYH